jgi:hypothetical protein
MKILFFIDSPSNYQLNFFEDLKKKHDIFVIYKNKYSNNHKLKIKKEKWILFLKNKKILFIDKILKKFNPKLIIIGGYKLNIKSSYINKNKIKKFYWLERVNEKNKIKRYHMDFLPLHMTLHFLNLKDFLFLNNPYGYKIHLYDFLEYGLHVQELLELL